MPLKITAFSRIALKHADSKDARHDPVRIGTKLASENHMPWLSHLRFETGLDTFTVC